MNYLLLAQGLRNCGWTELRRIMELRQIKQTEEVVGFICDVCGNSCFKVAGDHQLDSTEYATLSADWGYWSDGKDLTRHECHFCEACYEKVRKHIEEVLKGRVRVFEYSLASCPHENKMRGRDYVVDEQTE